MQLYSQYAQQLVLKDRVDVVQGGITSASREAIRPTLDRYKTLYFYNTQYEGGVCDRNVFCTGTTPAQTVDHVVTYAQKTWGKKAYIIAADYNYGQITAKWMTKFVRDGGGSVARDRLLPARCHGLLLGDQPHSAGCSRLPAVRTGGRQSEGFYRQWSAAGMKNKIPMASTVFGLGNELMSMDAAATNGIVTCYGWYNDLGTPASDAFVKGMQAKYGAGVTDLGELDSATYEGIMIWAEGVKKAGSVEQQKVIAALETGIVIDGSVRQGDDGSQNSPHHPQRLSGATGRPQMADHGDLSGSVSGRHRRCLRFDKEPNHRQAVRTEHLEKAWI